MKSFGCPDFSKEVRDYSQTEGIRSKAAVECVALTLEVVKGRKKGSWDDVRVEAERAREIIPASDRRNRATVDLMFLESYYYGGDYQDSIDAAAQLVAEYPDQRREKFMARITAALANRKLGNTPAAKVLLEANVTEAVNLEVADVFAADLASGKLMDVRSMSIQWLYLFAKADGNESAKNHWLSMIVTEYPDVARKAGLSMNGGE